jgi:hypothetical protein
MTFFAKGWFDYLNGVPPQAIRNNARAVEYERGRHAAALWDYECAQSGRTIKLVSYRAARLVMGVELRRMIDQERRWCAMRRRKAAVDKVI